MSTDGFFRLLQVAELAQESELTKARVGEIEGDGGVLPGMGKSPARIGTFNYSWLLVWNMIFILVLCFHRLGKNIPTDELTYFSEG